LEFEASTAPSTRDRNNVMITHEKIK
jgi:hypothetical protein